MKNSFLGHNITTSFTSTELHMYVHKCYECEHNLTTSLHNMKGFMTLLFC